MTMTLTGSGTGTVGVPNSATAQNSTSGTSIDFTGIPAGTKRITVMFSGVSTNGTSILQLQVGSGSISSSGYTAGWSSGASAAAATVTTGFPLQVNVGTVHAYSGHAVLTLQSSNIWVCSSLIVCVTGAVSGTQQSGSITLSGALDRIRLTTVNGTDTFDAGSINILYE